MIKKLRHLFSMFGLPEHIVSDNGSQFTSEEFRIFLQNNDIQHTRTPTNHPATNGLAERYVGHMKLSLKKMGRTEEPLQSRIDRFLLTYRVTPTHIGKSPSELLMNRCCIGTRGRSEGPVLITRSTVTIRFLHIPNGSPRHLI